MPSEINQLNDRARNGDQEALQLLQERCPELVSLAESGCEEGAQGLSILAAKLNHEVALAEVVRLVQRGDAMQEAIIDRCNEKAVPFLRGLLVDEKIEPRTHGDPEILLEDIKQEALLKVPKLLATAEKPTAFWSRFYHQLEWTFMDFMRRNPTKGMPGGTLISIHEPLSGANADGQEAATVLDPYPSGDKPPPDEQACLDEEIRVLKQTLRPAILRLGDPCSFVLILLYFAGLPLPAVAHTLGIPPEKIENANRDCTRKLEKQLTAQEKMRIDQILGKERRPITPLQAL